MGSISVTEKRDNFVQHVKIQLSSANCTFVSLSFLEVEREKSVSQKDFTTSSAAQCLFVSV